MKALVRVLLCCKSSSSEADLREVDPVKDVSLEDSTLQEAVSVAVPPSVSPEPEPRPSTPTEQTDSTKEVLRHKKPPKAKKKRRKSGDLVKEEADMHSGRHVPQARDAKPRKSILKRRE